MRATNVDLCLFDEGDGTLTRRQYHQMRPKSRTTDPKTSRDAAARVGGGAPAAVLAALAQYGAMADEELVANVPWFHGATLISARSRLRNAGLVVTTGGTRTSSRGCAQQVWCLSERGRLEARRTA